MGKLRDWLHGDGDRPRWSRLQYAVAACAEDLQDELQDEWNDWTPDKFPKGEARREGALRPSPSLAVSSFD